MTTAEELDARYGRTRRRRLPWILLGAVAVLAIGAFGWTTVQQQMDAVDVDDLGFEVVDEHTVQLRFGVTAPAGRDLVCALEALDEEFGVVGWRIVEIDGGPSHAQTVTERIRTVGEATTGLVNACWVA